jgi:hypothetical protein
MSQFTTAIAHKAVAAVATMAFDEAVSFVVMVGDGADQAMHLLAQRRELKGCTFADVKAKTLRGFAAARNVTLTVGTRGAAAGALCWPEDKAGAAGKKAHERWIKALIGQSQKAKEEKTPIEVPAHIAKIAAQLVKACGEYEEASRLLATAVAEARAA